MLLIGIFAVILLAVFIYLPAAIICLKVIRRSYLSGLPDFKDTVCLTFDDGPDPVYTPLILNELRALGVRATFFVLGSKAEEYPDLISAIAGEGHEIGEHGYSHLHPWKTVPWSYLGDLIAAHKLLNRLLDSSGPRRYRPTFGKANALTFFFKWMYCRAFAFWNIDPRDYSDQPLCTLVDRVITHVCKVNGPSVVLLHDGRIQGREKTAGMTYSSVGPICRELLLRGYCFKTVGEIDARKRRGSILAN
jgi:peptidoglycan/xylan/chitin deacetylase (PgdA/CDA1 family)